MNYVRRIHTNATMEDLDKVLEKLPAYSPHAGIIRGVRNVLAIRQKDHKFAVKVAYELTGDIAAIYQGLRESYDACPHDIPFDEVLIIRGALAILDDIMEGK